LNLTQISEAQKSFEIAHKETGVPVQIGKKLEILDSISNTNNFQTKALLNEELNLKPDEGERAKPQSNKTVRLEITLTQEQFNKLNEIKSLLSHKIPSQNTAEVLNVLFEQFLRKHSLMSKINEPVSKEENQLNGNPDIKGKPLTPQSETLPPKVAKAPLQVQSEKRSRYISAPIRRSLYQRASGCCEYRDQSGVRCSSRYQLEFDHIVPFALNGSNEADNIRIVCSKHNSYLASQKNIGLETTSYFLNK
jgi:5-methylcytosine-specific restriction endonuclease McrA